MKQWYVDESRTAFGYPTFGYNFLKIVIWGFPGGAVVESLPADAGDTGSSPGLGGSHMPQSS